MQSMKDILRIKDRDERQKAIETYKRAREEAVRNDPMREVKAALTARIMDCPMFLMYAIGPIPNFLQGKVPVDGLGERVSNAQRMMDSAKPEDKTILEESYVQEAELVMAMTHAFAGRDVNDEAQFNAIRQDVQRAFGAYMAQPPMERKHYLL